MKHTLNTVFLFFLGLTLFSDAKAIEYASPREKFVSYFLEEEIKRGFAAADANYIRRFVSNKFLTDHQIDAQFATLNRYYFDSYKILSSRSDNVYVMITSLKPKWSRIIKYKASFENGNYYIYPSSISQGTIEPWHSSLALEGDASSIEEFYDVLNSYLRK